MSSSEVVECSAVVQFKSVNMVGSREWKVSLTEVHKHVYIVVIVVRVF